MAAMSSLPATQEVCSRIGWTLETVATTGSTNADLLARTGSGLVLVAGEQTAGRGRLDRSWVSAPGDGLTFSVRLEVPNTVTNWGWIPLLAGIATAEAVRASGARDVGVKWPNDVVAGVGKLAGILSVREGNAAVIGIGLNLAFAADRPDPNAISVEEAGGNPDGDAILAALLGQLDAWWQRFVAAGGNAQRCGLTETYLAQCVTVGADVDVNAGDRVWSGHAQGIDAQGCLLVAAGDAVVPVSAGDVTLRA